MTIANLKSTMTGAPKQILCALALAAIATGAQAQGELDFSIGEDTVKAQVSSQVPYNELSWTAELLHYEDSGVNANVIGGGVFVAGRSNASSARQVAGLGGKALFVDADGTEAGLGIAIGGFLRHTLSQANLISLRGDVYIAPAIIAFQGLEHYMEFSGRVEYQLLDQANVYIGYRSVEADLQIDGGGEGEFEFEEGLMAGVNLRF